MDINDAQYLTVKELSDKIKFSQQSIYNMIYKGVFIKGTHYIKPSRKKVLFLWTAVHAWLESPGGETVEIQKTTKTETTKTNKSLINI
jgi:predicted DNA-binding transcriptional regulator AlpA